MLREILKPAAALLIVTFIVTSLLGLTYWVTAEPIAEMRIKTERETVRRLMPETEMMVDLQAELTGIIQKKIACYADDILIGYIITAAPIGYGGPIEIMVAFDVNGVVRDAEVLRHKETPGLGDDAVKHPFLGQFAGKSGRFALGEIDTVTSATVSSLAVAEGIRAASAYIDEFIWGQKP
ncbi:MAG: FMN-binding protein [Defluviitaleaceae bacterium]|nr:FMN-binding protein [Defluviitaleaceae bacterium]